MREAHYDKGWMLGGPQGLRGLVMGYDHCAEHEFGIEGIKRKLGVSETKVPLGLPDRQMTLLPKTLDFLAFTVSHVKNKKRNLFPAAYLGLAGHKLGADKIALATQVAESFGLSFHDEYLGPDPDEGTTGRALRNIKTAYSDSEFAILVRGAENVERLRLLYAAFQRLDVCIVAPSSFGFLRNGLAFGVSSSIAPEDAENILAKDQDHARLLATAAATGVESILKQTGKSWFALVPKWADSEKTRVEFFLNPCEQRVHNHGWFTVEELKQWAHNEGPVMQVAWLKEFERANPDTVFNAVRACERHRIPLGKLPRLVPAGPSLTEPGLKLDVAGPNRWLCSGVYTLTEFNSHLQAALACPDVPAASLAHQRQGQTSGSAATG